MLAAKMDHGEAYFMIGLLMARNHGYHRGTDAITWYMKGIEKNNAAATNAMGVMYFKGNHVPKDIEMSISFFRKATDLGDIFAPYNLARCYEMRIGVPEDREKATEYFLLAIGRNNNHAGDYFETKFFDTNPSGPEPEKEEDLCGFVSRGINIRKDLPSKTVFIPIAAGNNNDALSRNYVPDEGLFTRC